MSSINIRKATEDDIPKLVNIYLQLREIIHPGSRKTPGWMTDYVRGKMRQSKYSSYVAAVGEDLVGTIAVQLKEENTAYIGDAFVEPLYRRKVIMRQLEGKIIEYLKEDGVSRVELDVMSRNREGKSTWTALGYNTVKETMMKKI
jgi:ribosomal protein S18 acetylase RimI-like enzyme